MHVIPAPVLAAQIPAAIPAAGILIFLPRIPSAAPALPAHAPAIPAGILAGTVAAAVVAADQTTIPAVVDQTTIPAVVDQTTIPVAAAQAATTLREAPTLFLTQQEVPSRQAQSSLFAML